MLQSKTELFIQNSKKIFGDLYCYNNTYYINRKFKITITCKIHGNFSIAITNHLNKGIGCKKCSNILKSQNYVKNKEWFVEKASLKHNFKYDYSLVEYKGNVHKIEIICPIHGQFNQLAKCHLKGRGCCKCGKDILSNLYRDTTENFIKKANKFHNFKYDYSKTIYGKNG